MTEAALKQIKHLQEQLKIEREDKQLILSKLRGMVNKDIRLKASRKVKPIPNYGRIY
jgi:hypothetical protein